MVSTTAEDILVVSGHPTSNETKAFREQNDPINRFADFTFSFSDKTDGNLESESGPQRQEGSALRQD